MRWLPRAIPCLVACIALYFALWFSIETLRIFLSPLYGLDDPAFAQTIRGIGRRADLGTAGLLKLAAFFGAVKLAIATLFAVYLVGRLRAIWRNDIEHEVLDAGLLLVVLVTVVAAMPALLDGTTNLLAQYRLPLWLAGLAATLSMIERFAEEEDGETNRVTALMAERHALATVPLPPQRYGVSALRWNDLRRSANLTD
jgi:hypothetical protein